MGELRYWASVPFYYLMHAADLIQVLAGRVADWASDKVVSIL